MPRPSRSGVKGLHVYREGGRTKYKIEIEYECPKRGPVRYKETLPIGWDKTLAQKHAFRVWEGILDGTIGHAPGEPAKKPPTVGEALDRYLAWVATRNAESTVRKKRYQVERLKAVLGELRVDQVRPARISRYLEQRANDGSKASTLNHDLFLLKQFFKYAATMEWTSRDHALEVSELDRFKLPKRQPRYLTSEEEKRIVQAAAESFRPVVVFALETGLRQGEIAALRWNAIEVERRLVHVRGGKGDKDRTVPLTERALAVLAGLPSNREFVFVSKHGRAWSSSGLQTAWKRIQARTGIEARFHDLRATAATRWLWEGVDVITLASYLGHGSLEMVKRYAAACRPEMREGTASRVAGSRERSAFELPSLPEELGPRFSVSGPSNLGRDI